MAEMVPVTMATGAPTTVRAVAIVAPPPPTVSPDIIFEDRRILPFLAKSAVYSSYKLMKLNLKEENAKIAKEIKDEKTEIKLEIKII